MPSLGADMEAGTLIEWLKQPGDDVHRGDIIAVVETQKGAIEIEVFEDGRLDALLVEPGATVPVGTPLAVIDGAGEVPPTPAVEPPTPPAAAPRPMPAAAPSPTRTCRASPAARRLAAERGIDLTGIAGSGPDGAVVSVDILASRPERPAGLDLAEMRKAIAAAMARSKREIPHYYLSHTIDLSAAHRWLADTNAQRPPPERLLMGALFLKASALAVAAPPGFNGFYDNGFQPSDAVHTGMAVAIRGGGLIAPAIRDTDRLSLADLMVRMRDLVGRARAGRLRSSELTDATVTVSSLGERGVERLYGIIYPPQVAILGFGAPTTRPWAVADRIEARPTVVITLAADHRVSDGHAGARLLARIDQLLQTPEAL